MKNLELYFNKFRQNTIGYDKKFLSPYGEQRIIYADWIASGRLYKPIENWMSNVFAPYVGNTHSEASETGMIMTLSYHYAHSYIKKHVNAGPDDVIITAGFGMTAVVNKFQRILGLKIPEQLKGYLQLPDELRPVVFVTHMEHHSNQTSWLETVADVICIEPNDEGLINIENLYQKLDEYKDRKLKIGSFTACSNVTGIETPYHQLAKIMHQHGGYCFVDFACSAPYADINMHPDDPEEKLDAIFFSPHKFLGGPGTSGVLVFDSKLYKNKVPDQPGGGTVDWTNPWGQHKFISNIELREDGGTPGFLQAIRTSLCIKLKEEMSTELMRQRESELLKIAFEEFRKIPTLHILANNIENRLGVFSFYVEKIHYNLIVKLLNDRFGIQVRGGCSCAGTYGHFLLHVDKNTSKHITEKINLGDLSEKPGWIRMSIHPTMTNEELYCTVDALKQIIRNIDAWAADYDYIPAKNEFVNKSSSFDLNNIVNNFFNVNFSDEK